MPPTERSVRAGGAAPDAGAAGPGRVAGSAPWIRRAFVAAGCAACLAFAARASADEVPPPDAAPPEPPPPVEILGTRVLPPDVAGRAAGLPPKGTRDAAGWARRAARRIVAAYRKQGYAAARAWARATPDGRVLIDVDEGRMSGMVFLGTSPRQSILFRVDVGLVKDVLHVPTLERGLEEIRAKHRLLSVTWSVEDREEMIPNGLGEPVALRELRVVVVRPDGHDWSVEADLDATFGLVPGVTYRKGSLFVDDDRTRLKLAIGVPYRRYLFDARPQFTWVFGELEAGHRTPPFADRRLVLSYEAIGTLAHYDRADLGIRSYLAGRWSALADLQLQVVPGLVTMALAFGVGATYVFDLEPVPSEAPDPEPLPPERTRFRFLVRTRADVDADPEGPLAGRKRNLRVQAVMALTRAGHPMLDLSLRGRYEFSFGYHDLLFKGRGLYLLGEVLFWDDRPLANECQKVFFGNRYWVRQSAQLEVAGRFGVWKDKVKLGIFHDLSVFADRSRPGRPVSLANGFGPSAHFLLFDQFRLDLYYGFGFAPVGFDHNFSMAFQSTF